MDRTLQHFTRLQEEFELAHRVQRGLLPQKPPVVPGLDIWAAIRSAYQVGAFGVGGDFYDFITVCSEPGTQGRNTAPSSTNPGARGYLTFVVGDICGKGLAASILMSMTRKVLQMVIMEQLGSSQASVDPAKTIRQANSLLYDDFMDTTAFATVFIGFYDPTTQLLVYANAGHTPVVHVQARRGAICGGSRLLVADGVPLGVLPSQTIASQTLSSGHSKNHYLHFRAGDVLLVGTDGIVESTMPGANLISEYNQLIEKVELMADQPAHLIAESVFNIGEKKDGKFIGENRFERMFSRMLKQGSNDKKARYRKNLAAQDDDQALVVIKNTGAQPHIGML
jgi:phosphoserine phosphatase RsbU/P